MFSRLRHNQEPTFTSRAEYLNAPNPREERKTSRREFIQRFGAAAVASYLAIDTFAGEALWEKSQPEILKFHNPEAERLFPNTYTLVIGGFGVPNDRMEGLASAVNTLLSDYGQVAYLENSDTGLDMDVIEAQTVRFIKANNIKRLRLYGHSMGGMVATELAARLHKQVDIEIEIDAVILDCTPASYKDVKGDGQSGTLFLETTDEVSMHLGPATQDLIQIGVALTHGQHDILEVISHTTEKTLKGCSTKLLQDQARFLRQFDIQKYRHVFPDSVDFIHLRPEDYNSDPTINNKTAVSRWENGLRRPVLDVPVEGSGHADPGDHLHAYFAALYNAVKRHHLFDQSLYDQAA